VSFYIRIHDYATDGYLSFTEHPHVYDMALCGSTVRNVALGLWLVGHPCDSKTHNFERMVTL